jgi:hypothetical protein
MTTPSDPGFRQASLSSAAGENLKQSELQRPPAPELVTVSPRLLAASNVERAKFEISPSGYGIH